MRKMSLEHGLVTKEALSARHWGEKRIQDGGLFARVIVWSPMIPNISRFAFLPNTVSRF